MDLRHRNQQQISYPPPTQAWRIHDTTKLFPLSRISLEARINQTRSVRMQFNEDRNAKLIHQKLYLFVFLIKFFQRILAFRFIIRKSHRRLAEGRKKENLLLEKHFETLHSRQKGGGRGGHYHSHLDFVATRY